MAKLPNSMLEPTLADLAFMPFGTVAYTLPWAMWADLNRDCWLVPSYPISKEPQGTQNMRIEYREDGYHVWPPQGETYNPQASGCYVGVTEFVPVAVIHEPDDR